MSAKKSLEVGRFPSPQVPGCPSTTGYFRGSGFRDYTSHPSVHLKSDPHHTDLHIAGHPTSFLRGGKLELKDAALGQTVCGNRPCGVFLLVLFFLFF